MSLLVRFCLLSYFSKPFFKDCFTLFAFGIVEVLHEIESKVKGYDDAVTFNSRMSTLYISKKAVTVLWDIYRQIFHLEIEKDEKKKEQRLAMFEIKREIILCKIEWPICHHFLEREKIAARA